MFIFGNHICMKTERWSHLLVLSLFLLLATVSAAAEPTATYFYKVAEDGETTALITITGEGAIIIPLPSDVVDPEIRSGIYVLAPDGIEVTVGESGKTQVGYVSSFHTRKEAGIWYFEAQLREGSSAKMALPLSVQIVQTRPAAAIKRDIYRELSWAKADTLQVSYIIKKEQADGTTSGTARSLHLFPTVLILVVVIILSLGAGYYFLKKRKQKPAEDKTASENTAEEKAAKREEDLPTITDAQMNILKAANENDALILTTLLKNNGKIKRNVLEKETQLAKSSLASALENLEKKNLVKVDRTFHVHYITLSSWFKELK